MKTRLKAKKPPPPPQDRIKRPLKKILVEARPTLEEFFIATGEIESPVNSSPKSRKSKFWKQLRDVNIQIIALPVLI